ncbi:MAG: NERD domain-containing protein [Angelakisella sp.]|nr:NERD domain-containing protein [Angelakisella sp.]
MYNWQDILFGFMIAVALGALLYGLWKNNLSSKHSERTKRGISRTLRSMAPLREWRVLDDVTITDRKGKEHTVDHLVAGPFGVLVFTDLHKRGGYYGELRDGEWVISTGGENQVETHRERIPSPVKNNEAFVAAFRELLTAGKVYNVPVEALCPVTQSQVEVFVTGARDQVVEHKRLREVLSRQRYQKDNKVDPEKLLALLPGAEK